MPSSWDVSPSISCAAVSRTSTIWAASITPYADFPSGGRSMIRVAVISMHGSPLARLGGPETGGMNVYVRELSRHLGLQGMQVDIFTRWQDPREPAVVPLGERARVINLQAGPIARIEKNTLHEHLPEFVCNLRRFTERHNLRYDILHSHYWVSGWVSRLLQDRWHIPHVAMFHTLGAVKNRARVGENEPPLRIETERRIIAQSDRLVAPCPSEKTQMIRLYGATPHKVEIIPCGVDLDLFRPLDRREIRRSLGLTGCKVVLFVGRMDRVKGLDILLRAVGRLEDRSRLRVLIVGGEGPRDPTLEHYQRLVRELAIGEWVRFEGAVEQGRLPTYYSAADVCVVPSYSESFGMVAAESLACGTPVLASRVGGLTSTVRDGETGYLVPWRCEDPFAERLELVLANAALRQRFSTAARPSVKHLAWPFVATQVATLYENVLRNSARRYTFAATEA
ncbi:MAG: glycosyltransferase family 1 protein [Chloroflexota bacterium]|nr:MAG: glycosyltransferase family 1 protein [Chloroflexota bacterium]